MAHLAVANQRLWLHHATPYGATLVLLALRLWMLIIRIVRYMSSFILSFVLSIQGFLGTWSLWDSLFLPVFVCVRDAQSL